MNTLWRSIFYILLTFFILHTIRDILQILNVNFFLATMIPTNHRWCRPYCDYAAFPHEIFCMIGTVIVLRRNKIGILGFLVLLSLPLWTIGFVMEYLDMN